MDDLHAIVNSFDVKRSSAISHIEPASESIHIRITAREFVFEDVFVFSIDDLVWTVKQKMLASLMKQELTDGLNYGLYCPPSNEKTGKFLDEERPLRDYPLPGPIAVLEFKYKRRIFKSSEMSTSNLKKINTQSNWKSFLQCIVKCDADKISKWLTKGIDPNFNNCGEGETPLTLSASLSHQRAVMLSLVNGGAYLDFRNRDGLTPIHVAAQTGNKEALRTLLDLGSSPNYKDGKGWTAVLVCTTTSIDAHECLEMLLHERAELGTVDAINGWTEVHYACMNDRIQELEALLFYGADRNAQSLTGDTPLHICAKHNKMECAKILLLRGSDKTLYNIARHTAAQLAALSENKEMVEIITQFNTATDIVLFNELPHYNQKRRATISKATIRNLKRSRSNMQIDRLFSRDANSSSSLSSSAADHINKSNGYIANGRGAGRFGTGRGDTTLTRPTALQIFSEVSASNGDIPKSLTKLSNSIDTRYWDEQIIRINKSKKSYGFALGGPTAADKQSFSPTLEVPARQFIDDIKSGSSSELAGLKANDYIFLINGEDVSCAKHQHCINLIQKSGAILTIKICRKKADDLTSGKWNGLDDLEKLDEELDAANTQEVSTESAKPYTYQEHVYTKIPPNHETTMHSGDVSEPVRRQESLELSTVPFSPAEFQDELPEQNIHDDAQNESNSSNQHDSNKDAHIQDLSPNFQRAVVMHEENTGNIRSYVDRNNNNHYEALINNNNNNKSTYESNNDDIDVNLGQSTYFYDEEVNDHLPLLSVAPPDNFSSDVSSDAVSPVHVYANDTVSSLPVENFYVNDEVFSTGSPLPDTLMDMQTLDFAGQAERVRQMYLEKKNSGTLKKGSLSTSYGSETSSVFKPPEYLPSEKSRVSVDPRKLSPIKKEVVVDDMREIIAQKALERERSNEVNRQTDNKYELSPPAVPIIVSKPEARVSSGGKLDAAKMSAFGSATNSTPLTYYNSKSGAPSSVNSSIDNTKFYPVAGTVSAPKDVTATRWPSASGQNEKSKVWTAKTPQKPVVNNPGFTLSYKSPARLPSPVLPSSQKYSHMNGKPDLPARNMNMSIATWVIPPPNQFASVDVVDPPNYAQATEYNASSTLRSVASRTPSNSMVFRAKPAVGAYSASAPNQYGSKKLELWSTADVGDWLSSLGYEEYKAKFLERKITGQMLARAGQNELTSYGVLNMLHKIKMDRELKKFKN